MFILFFRSFLHQTVGTFSGVSIFHLTVVYCNYRNIWILELLAVFNPFYSRLNRLPLEQQVILGAFGYLNPTKLNHLGKIVFSFIGLSKVTPQNEN